MRPSDASQDGGRGPGIPITGTCWVAKRSWVGHAMIVFLVGAMLALIGRLAYIQGHMRTELLEWSQRRQCSTVVLPGRRGAILDRRLRVLAGSHDRPTIYADPRLIEDHEAAARQLAMVLGSKAADLKKLLDEPTSPEFVILKRAADAHEAEGVKELKIRGVGMVNEPVRSYPMGKLAAHVIGFVGAEGSGLEGVELAYEKHLKATAGKRLVYRDVHRRAIFQEPDGFVAPRDGMHVVLTIDANIQEVLDRELSQAVERFQAECAVGVVLSPKTGEVFAMSCAPSYDPAEPNKIDLEHRRNRVLTDPMEPGSSFKPFVMAIALAEGVTKPTETIFCHNGLYVTGARRLSDHEPYGTLSVEQIMVHSSNIGMAILGQRLGNMRMRAGLRQFGFGAQTGIDLPGEGEGLFMPLKAWNSFTTTSVPMGQELAITPLQLATAFCGLINGGHKVRPHVVSAILSRSGEVIEDRRKVEDLGRVTREDISAEMRNMLAKVVNEGTGRNCRLEQWQVMGKTGTAQVPRKGRPGYEPDAYLGTFIAGVPARDPEVVCLIQVRKPNRRIAYYGSAVAAPSVRTVLAYTLPYLGIPPDEKAPGEKTTSLALDRRP